MKSLFVVNIVFASILSFSSKIKYYGGASIILLGCFTIIGLFAAYRDFPLSKTLAEFVLLPIVALGYVWKKKGKDFRFNVFVFLISFVILLLCVHVKIEISSHKLYTNPLLFYLVSVCGIYFSLSLCYIIRFNILRNLFISIGYHTMPIFVWHLLLFRGISLVMIFIYGMNMDSLCMHPIIPIDNEIWCWIYTFIGIFIPLLFTKMRNNILKKKE